MTFSKWSVWLLYFWVMSRTFWHPLVYDGTSGFMSIYYSFGLTDNHCQLPSFKGFQCPPKNSTNMAWQMNLYIPYSIVWMIKISVWQIQNKGRFRGSTMFRSGISWINNAKTGLFCLSVVNSWYIPRRIHCWILFNNDKT